MINNRPKHDPAEIKAFLLQRVGNGNKLKVDKFIQQAMRNATQAPAAKQVAEPTSSK